MRQTDCRAQRPIHSQADRPDAHSCIRAGSGGLCRWGMEKVLFAYTLEYHEDSAKSPHVVANQCLIRVNLIHSTATFQLI